MNITETTKVMIIKITILALPLLEINAIMEHCFNLLFCLRSGCSAVHLIADIKAQLLQLQFPLSHFQQREDTQCLQLYFGRWKTFFFFFSVAKWCKIHPGSTSQTKQKISHVLQCIWMRCAPFTAQLLPEIVAYRKAGTSVQWCHVCCVLGMREHAKNISINV